MILDNKKVITYSSVSQLVLLEKLIDGPLKKSSFIKKMEWNIIHMKQFNRCKITRLLVLYPHILYVDMVEMKMLRIADLLIAFENYSNVIIIVHSNV